MIGIIYSLGCIINYLLIQYARKGIEEAFDNLELTEKDKKNYLFICIILSWIFIISVISKCLVLLLNNRYYK